MALTREERRNRFRMLVLQKVDGSVELSDGDMRLLIERVIRDSAEGGERLSVRERRETKKDVFDSLRGLDVLQDLMEDPAITEIMHYDTARKDGRMCHK